MYSYHLCLRISSTRATRLKRPTPLAGASDQWHHICSEVLRQRDIPLRVVLAHVHDGVHAGVPVQQGSLESCKGLQTSVEAVCM